MAQKMTLKELISFEEMLIEEDLSAEDNRGIRNLGQPAFLLDDSCILLLNGKALKDPQ